LLTASSIGEPNMIMNSQRISSYLGGGGSPIRGHSAMGASAESTFREASPLCRRALKKLEGDLLRKFKAGWERQAEKKTKNCGSSPKVGKAKSWWAGPRPPFASNVGRMNGIIVRIARNNTDTFRREKRQGMEFDAPTISGPICCRGVMPKLRRARPHLGLMLYEYQTEIVLLLKI